MKLLVARTWALLLAVLFVAAAAAASVGQNDVTPQQDDPPKPAGSSPRTVLLEMFTGTWCTWCGVIKPGISRLLDEFGPDRMLMIAYHQGDIFANASMDTTRRAFYQSPWYGWPTTIIDGGGYSTGTSLFVVGSQGDSPSDYNFYKAKVNTELTAYTNVQLTLTGDLTPTTASVTARVYASDLVAEMNIMLRLILYEDALYATQVNGPPIHKYVARQLYEIPVMIGMGQTLYFSHTFTPNPAWDKNRMGVIGFLQNDVRLSYSCYSGRTCYNSPVMQAAKLQYVAADTLYVRDDDLTDMDVPTLRGEYMEAALSQANRPTDVWNVLDFMDTGTNDVRGSPTMAEMEQYAAVIWSTGSASGILTPANVADLSGYLNGYGNLFIHGENVATDLAATAPTFLSSYLHATHGTDPGPPVPAYMNGVPGDPVTGIFGANNLFFAGVSPDNVDPAMGGITLLNYIGMNSAGVRADHDPDSRVITYGMNYFQSTTDTRKAQMIDSALNWLDGIAAPKVSVVSPNGGEEFNPGDIATIEWKAIDVEIPIDGVDIYFTETLSSPSWTPVATMEPNDGVYSWTVPSVQTMDCGVRIVVRDGDFTTPDGEAISAAPCTIGAPDSSMTKDVSNPTPQIGEEITYIITVTNNGVKTADVTVTDVLPMEVTYVSDDGSQTGSSNYNVGTRTLTWDVLVPGMDSRVLNLVVNVTAGNPGDTVWNTANFDSTDLSGGYPQSGSDQVSFQLPTTQVWSITLTPGIPPGNTGKFLLSIPLLLTDYRVTAVLMSIAGKYDYVRAYDPTDSVIPWKDYVPGRTYNSLKEIRPHMGFWINMIQTGTLTVTGARPTTTNIVFNDEGWYLVGYPSLTTTYTIGDLKASIGLTGILAESYDVNSPPYNLWKLPDTYVMQPGEGYWIYVPAACTWSVTG